MDVNFKCECGHKRVILIQVFGWYLSLLKTAAKIEIWIFHVLPAGVFSGDQ